MLSCFDPALRHLPLLQLQGQLQPQEDSFYAESFNFSN
jgi:hypothetical protein